MQPLQQRVRSLAAQIAQLRAPQAQAEKAASTARSSGTDGTAPKRELKLGGAIRFNYFYQRFSASSRTKHGQSDSTGCALGIGPVFPYVDLIRAARHPGGGPARRPLIPRGAPGFRAAPSRCSDVLRRGTATACST